jgi:hypothetical protein
VTGQAISDLRGLLAEGVLPELLRRIFLAKRSGALHLAFGIERSDIDFDDGYLVHAVTSLPGARLGDLLVQVGFLSACDRDACLEISVLSSVKLGETLLRHGLLDAESLGQGLALQLREVVARTLCWTGGVYSFTDRPAETTPSREGFSAPRLDPREVLLDATWTLVSDPAIDGFLGDLNRKVQKASDERLLHPTFRLTPPDAFLLSRVDGLLTAEQLLDQSSVSIDEAKASLAGLLAVGVIEYVDAPPPTSVTINLARLEISRLAARINSPDPFEILGVRPEVSADELRSSYLKLLRSCDPAATTDPQLRPILVRMSAELARAFKEIERRLGRPRPEALKKPSGRGSVASAVRRSGKTGPVPPPSAKATPPLPPAPAQAQASPVRPSVDPMVANEAAAQAFDEGRFHEALAILHDAIPLLEGRARRSARVQKARVLLAVENGARLAEEEMKLAIGEDPGNAEAHAVLGGIYRERGSQALAMMEYRKARELEPRNVAAREALQQLRDAPTQPPPASVLKRIFGR